jgi:hypothetical protein
MLPKQSGIGFNSDTELYEFSIYTWTSLNKSHPKIIRHKIHIMPFRDMISYILHDVQANGDSAFSLEKPTPLDPRLDAINQATSASSPVPPTKSSKKLYSKSKGKRMKEEDESDGGTPAPKKEKVEKIGFPTAILGFTYELMLARKAKEAFLSPQQKTLQLLEKEYQTRLDIMAFIKGTTFMQNEGNAVTFITLTNVEVRDQSLETKLSTILL